MEDSETLNLLDSVEQYGLAVGKLCDLGMDDPELMQELNRALCDVEKLFAERFGGKCASYEIDKKNAVVFFDNKFFLITKRNGQVVTYPLINTARHFRAAAARRMPLMFGMLEEEQEEAV